MSDKPLFPDADATEAVYAPEQVPDGTAREDVEQDEMPIAPDARAAAADRGIGLIGGVGTGFGVGAAAADADEDNDHDSSRAS